VLSEKRIGLVAHFYMDPQVQGVLSAAAERWPHIHISDSLVMADSAVRMAEAGCTSVAVLGVDFMSENVRAILDEAGHADVAVSHPSPLFCHETWDLFCSCCHVTKLCITRCLSEVLK
jgi:quinolinate synthase